MLDQGNNLCLISLNILITVCWTIYGEVKCQSLLGVKGFKFLYLLPNSFPGRVGGFEANKEKQHRTETRGFRRNEAGMYTSSITELLGFSVAGGREGGKETGEECNCDPELAKYFSHDLAAILLI